MAAIPSSESNLSEQPPVRARFRPDFSWIRRYPGYAALFSSQFLLSYLLWSVLYFKTGRSWREISAFAENPGFGDLGREGWRFLLSSGVHLNGLQLWFSVCALPIVGQDAEECFGAKRMILIFFVAALCGTLVTRSMEPTFIVESSAGVFALFGALFALLFRHPRAIGADLRKVLIRGIILLVGMSLFIGLILPLAVTAAHAGGFICGVVLGWWLKPTARYEPVVQT